MLVNPPLPCCAVLRGLHCCAPAAWGLLVYGLLVFCMEFLPFGAVNPPEVAEYFTLVGRARGTATHGLELVQLYKAE